MTVPRHGSDGSLDRQDCIVHRPLGASSISSATATTPGEILRTGRRARSPRRIWRTRLRLNPVMRTICLISRLSPAMRRTVELVCWRRRNPSCRSLSAPCQQAGVDGPGIKCLSDVGHRTTHRGQKGLPAIVEQMPPVRDLHCIRKSPGNGAGVTAIAVAGHDLYPGVAVQPGFDRGRFAAGKNVDDPPPFQIADQGSIPPTASPGPIIDPDHAQLFRGAARSSTHAPKKRIRLWRDNLGESHRVCSRYRSGAHSVHPVAMSVTVSVCTKLPFATGPQCATRSASTKPGGGSSQSENVRTGMLLRTDDGAAARRRLLPFACSRTWRSDRSIVDALMASTAARICGPSSHGVRVSYGIDSSGFVH